MENKDRSFWLKYTNWDFLNAEENDVKLFFEAAEGVAQIFEKNSFFLNEGYEKEDESNVKLRNVYTLKNGNIIFPKKAKENLEAVIETGLLFPNISEEYGGLNLKQSLILRMGERICQEDSWQALVALTMGGAKLIERTASKNIKQKLLKKIIEENKTISMDLTEPGAGSDLSSISTSAEFLEKDETGKKYIIEGLKCFITFPGDYHLVLAKDKTIENENPFKQISLFLVEKTDKVKYKKLEEKLGIKSTPTAEIVFDKAEGYLIGEEGKGLNYMLNMMNEERLNVGVQSLAIIEKAYSIARKYAEERKQGFLEEIINYPLVQEILKEIKISIEAIRTLVYNTGYLIDSKEILEKDLKSINKQIQNLRDELNENAPEKKQFDEVYKFALNKKKYLEERVKAIESWINLLIPITKAYSSTKAVEMTAKAIQVEGGYGFIEENILPRLYRDAKITEIYEGTNQIQQSLVLKDLLKGIKTYSWLFEKPSVLLKYGYKALKFMKKQKKVMQNKKSNRKKNKRVELKYIFGEMKNKLVNLKKKRYYVTEKIFEECGVEKKDISLYLKDYKNMLKNVDAQIKLAYKSIVRLYGFSAKQKLDKVDDKTLFKVISSYAGNLTNLMTNTIVSYFMIRQISDILESKKNNFLLEELIKEKSDLKKFFKHKFAVAKDFINQARMESYKEYEFIRKIEEEGYDRLKNYQMIIF